MVNSEPEIELLAHTEALLDARRKLPAEKRKPSQDPPYRYCFDLYEPRGSAEALQDFLSGNRYDH